MLLSLTCAPGAPATHLCTRCSWHSPVHQVLLSLTCAPHAPATHLCTRCSCRSPVHHVFICPSHAPAAHPCTTCTTPFTCPSCALVTHWGSGSTFLPFFFPLSTIWLTPVFQNPSRVGCKTLTGINKWLVKHRAQSYWGTPMRRNSF